jgi:hypothetical protein
LSAALEDASSSDVGQLGKTLLIPAGVKADSLTGFQTGKHLTMSIGLRDWVNA